MLLLGQYKMHTTAFQYYCSSHKIQLVCVLLLTTNTPVSWVYSNLVSYQEMDWLKISFHFVTKTFIT